MKKALTQGLSIVVAGGLISCALSVEPAGAGKACTADGRCASGYLCSTDRRCVTAGEALDSFGGREAGSTSAPSGLGSTPGSGGRDGHDTPADAAPRASGGRTSVVDAAPPTATPPDGGAVDAACERRTAYYADDDGDGYGSGDAVDWGCSPPSGTWVLRAGDCDDDGDRVFPGQTAYFGVAYPSQGGDSFDYDCSGAEDLDKATPGASKDCATLPLLGCVGSGFAATGRQGAAVSPLCGSTELVTCAGLLLCGATTSLSEPKGCR